MNKIKENLLDNTIFTYKQIRDKLLKYKKEYEEEENQLLVNPLMHTNDQLIVKGHLRMIDILLDDLDSESGITWII